jgi:hypothetical protein
MLDIPHTTQKLQNFFRAGDNRQLLGLFGGWNDFLQAPILMKRDFVKETKSCYGNELRAICFAINRRLRGRGAHFWSTI